MWEDMGKMKVMEAIEGNIKTIREGLKEGLTWP